MMLEKQSLATEAIKERGTPPDQVEEATARVVLAMMRELSLQDFFLFMDVMLDCRGLSRSFHGPLCDFMMEEGEEKMILAPRGHLKSTISTVGYALWRMLKNPEIRILICNYKLDNAKMFLSQIKGYLLNYEMIRTCFQELIPDPKATRWNETAMTLRRTSNPKEATVEVAGVGTEVTGRHYDLILFDDIMGPENTTTKEQMQKAKTWFNQMQFVLEPGGEQVVTGTRWDFEDIYGWILESQVPPFKVFHKGIFGPPVDPGAGWFEDATIIPIWSEKFSKDRIKRIEQKMAADPKVGRAMFVKQYFNLVIDEVGAPFKRKQMVQYSPEEIPEMLAISITCDPAISERETADYACILVRGVDREGKWWVLDVWIKRGPEPMELLNELFLLYKKWVDKGHSVDACAIEYTAYQKSLKYLLRDEMFRRNLFLPMVELKNSNKDYRIRGLVPRWSQGGILVPKEMTVGVEELLDEIWRFPNCKHDDPLDALAMHDEIQVAPSLRQTKQKGSQRRDRYGYAEEKEENTHYGFFT